MQKSIKKSINLQIPPPCCSQATWDPWGEVPPGDGSGPGRRTAARCGHGAPKVVDEGGGPQSTGGVGCGEPPQKGPWNREQASLGVTAGPSPLDSCRVASWAGQERGGVTTANFQKGFGSP